MRRSCVCSGGVGSDGGSGGWEAVFVVAVVVEVAVMVAAVVFDVALMAVVAAATVMTAAVVATKAPAVVVALELHATSNNCDATTCCKGY